MFKHVSWKTSAAGIAAIIAAIAEAVAAQLDSDAATVADWPLVIGMVLAGIGLMRARDNDKTSEQVRAKTDWTSRGQILRLTPLLLILALSTGCANWQRADPLQQYAAIQEHYIGVVQGLIEARQANLITAEDWTEHYLPLIRQGDALLDEIGAAARAGNPAAADAYINAARNLLRELVRMRTAPTPTGARHESPADHRHRLRSALAARGVHPQPGAAQATRGAGPAGRARAAAQVAGRSGWAAWHRPRDAAWAVG